MQSKITDSDGCERTILENSAWSAEYATLIDELGEQLQMKPQFRERVALLFRRKFNYFIKIRVYEVPAGTAFQNRYVLEPSDCLARLCLALRTNDSNSVSIIEHELLS